MRRMNESVDSGLQEAIDRSINLLTNFSIPLYVESNGRPHHLGTAFFVQAGDDCFLVSAAHVFGKYIFS